MQSRQPGWCRQPPAGGHRDSAGSGHNSSVALGEQQQADGAPGAEMGGTWPQLLTVLAGRCCPHLGGHQPHIVCRLARADDDHSLALQEQQESQNSGERRHNKLTSRFLRWPTAMPSQPAINHQPTQRAGFLPACAQPCYPSLLPFPYLGQRQLVVSEILDIHHPRAAGGRGGADQALCPFGAAGDGEEAGGNDHEIKGLGVLLAAKGRREE